MRELIETGRAQVAITSHSPSVMQRIDPKEVRHVRRSEEEGRALVNSIQLPEDESEAFKYVREGILAYPELYFARVVVLCEGDSEEVVLPKIATALGVEIDLSLVSVVPLGGRHVNHFWRLLNDLSIPHVTLLDLDRERHGGGWGRIQYAIRELLDVGCDAKKLLEVDDDKGTKSILPTAKLIGMGGWNVEDTKNMRGWINCLEDFNVFYSAPLDFDFMMMNRFFHVYQDLPDGAEGPDVPEDVNMSPGLQAQNGAIRAVLKPKGGDGSTYSDEEKLAFFWYRYLFLGRSKPVSHLRAIVSISSNDLRSKCPPVLKRLIHRVQEQLGVLGSEEE
jgi:putative ATP-dependent endonuclease of the OLD family